ncbi:substrate-binding periplasmic protein [Thalassotalea atypica]|uniref:substrate-binding periplasmic protein n=1 Tax=Thalassotalea atypica TaxID=2054316 RepID=UPI0025746FF4|nr:transporter substrate-binding domain-containing protein [Thalassotalea atypica]
MAAYSYPPFSGELLRNGGVWLDLVSQAFAKVDYHVEYTFFPFARVFSESQFGQQQGVVCLWYSQIRSESYFFSAPYFYNEMKILKKTGRALPIEKLYDLTKYRVGSVRGYLLPPKLESLGLNLEFVDTDSQNLKKLVAERIDFMIVDKYTASYMLQKEQPDSSHLISTLETTFEREANYLAIAKTQVNGSDLIDEFNKGMLLLKESGEYQRIMAVHGFEQ